MNSLMQGSGGPWESISLSVGSNHKLCAWRAGCLVIGPGTRFSHGGLHSLKTKPGKGNCP